MFLVSNIVCLNLLCYGNLGSRYCFAVFCWQIIYIFVLVMVVRHGNFMGSWQIFVFCPGNLCIFIFCYNCLHIFYLFVKYIFLASWQIYTFFIIYVKIVLGQQILESWQIDAFFMPPNLCLIFSWQQGKSYSSSRVFFFSNCLFVCDFYVRNHVSPIKLCVNLGA